MELERFKANTLSKIFGINKPVKLNKSSSPDIELISKLKGKIDIDNSIENLQLIDNFKDNPLFRLSIKDFENICKDKDTNEKKLFNMMIKILDTDEKRLANICKNINIFKEYIKSSSESIKNKMKMQKMSILDLPDDMRKKIVEICAKKHTYILQDWIPSHYIIMKYLSANYNAIDFLSLPENQKYIDYPELSKNTNFYAINLINERLLVEKNIPYKQLQEEKNKIDWDKLLANSVAINGLEKEFEEYFLKGKKKNLHHLLNNENPKAIQILKKLLKTGKYKKKDINWDCISGNPSSEAFALLQENIDKVNWKYLSKNTHPGAIKSLEDAVEEQMEWYDMEEFDDYAELDDDKKIDWELLSSNPKAIDILIKKWKAEKRLMRFNDEIYDRLKESNMIISWEYVSSNPEAIELIKKKLKLENKLSENRYYNLSKFEKISWKKLSSNPNAIKILSLPENKDMIDWNNLSKNPNAMKLIKKKIIEEKSLSLSNNSSSNISSSNESSQLFYDDSSFLESSTDESSSYEFLSGDESSPEFNYIKNSLLSTNPSIFTLK
jgi:hypothetical protein